MKQHAAQNPWASEPGCNPAATVHPPASSTGAADDETTPHHGTPRTTTESYRSGFPTAARSCPAVMI